MCGQYRWAHNVQVHSWGNRTFSDGYSNAVEPETSRRYLESFSRVVYRLSQYDNGHLYHCNYIGAQYFYMMLIILEYIRKRWCPVGQSANIFCAIMERNSEFQSPSEKGQEVTCRPEYDSQRWRFVQIGFIQKLVVTDSKNIIAGAPFLLQSA